MLRPVVSNPDSGIWFARREFCSIVPQVSSSPNCRDGSATEVLNNISKSLRQK